jgi:hypothetical protein
MLWLYLGLVVCLVGALIISMRRAPGETGTSPVAIVLICVFVGVFLAGAGLLLKAMSLG